MKKTLIKHGNSLALVIDKPILEMLQISADTPLELTTDGDSLLVSPVRDDARQLSGPQDYIVQVTVEDQTGESVSKRAAVTAHESELYVGLHAQE